jgi:2-polyprenyl-3-methyl-5-hydroxy-6-metoxy-1,4-benzoquinol methylase
MSLPSSFNCQACGETDATEIAGFTHLPRVTSDSKPFRPGGRLFVCNGCGLVQKITDARWLEEIGEIYRSYEMYHQSASNDQAVFDPASGRPRGRCEVLAQRLLESDAIPRRGALLDVGAGSGAMLGAFSAACDGWKLYGLDLDDRKEQALRAIPRFEQLYTVPPGELPRQFDLITLIHSLEHFTDPLQMLLTLQKNIVVGGQLFVEVNNAAKTPFDLIVADHLCHFTPQSLAHMLQRANFRVEAAKTDWIHKEISLLAVPHRQSNELTHDEPGREITRIKNDVAWLNRMLIHARESANSNFGIFGTSVAATWLASGLGEAVKFFVDEDPARENRTHLGKPILKPAQIPVGAVVYLAFVHEVSAAIINRLSNLPVTYATLPASA